MTSTNAASGGGTNSASLFGHATGSGNAVPANLRPFQLVLPQAHLLQDWFGIRSTMENHGFTPNLSYVSDVAGNPIGGERQGITHADNLGVSLQFDLEKLIGLQGATFLATASEREGNSLSKEYVGNVFTIQQVFGGSTFKLIDLAYQQQLFEDRVEFRVGRIAAGDDFMVSPYDWLFMQNAFDGNPVGIFFNAPGMTAYPNAAWGGLAKLKPSARTYIMGGVYNGDPSIRANSHNGADMSIAGPVFAIAEAGYQRNGLRGDDGLLGNYRVGGWYDDSSYMDYKSEGQGTPKSKRGNYGFYTLVDQVLMAWGERSENRGLGVCGSVLVSPDESVSQMPYFLSAGVVARGFFPSRQRDAAGFGIVYGDFSSDLRHAQEGEQLLEPTVGVQNYETALEWTYRAYFDNSAIYFQPDLQYVIHPGATGKIDDALVLGCQIGINF